ncbi:MAG: glycerol kinase GlpK [Armatimonadota bacterium]
MSPYLLALDQGTTSSRAMLVDAQGQPAGVAAREFPQLYPQPGWVEHDPEAIWESQLAAVEALLEERGRPEVAALGITNQRETTLLWRRSDGRPVYPAIVWQDRRTAARCEQLRAEGRTGWLQERTGLLPDPYFSATKLEWLLEQVPGARAQAEAGELAFGTVDTWLLWKLTGGAVHRTDRTNASRTLLWNLREERWDPELLELFGIPESVLPEVLSSAARFTDAGSGPGWRGAPAAGIAGDQQAALYGQAGWEPGLAKNTYGTGCFLLLNTGRETPVSANGLLTTAACGPDGGGAYAVEGSVFVAGAAVQWLRDGLGLIRTAAESEAVARSVPDTGGVYLVPAFTGLGAPYWDPHARGTMVGLTRGTTRAHLVRAALEAIALQTCDVVEAMAADAGAPLRTLRVDGGASANDFLMQLQADLLGIPVERAACAETTALGAAYLAGVGCGLWRPRELASLWRADRVFEPRMSEDQRQSLRHGWRRAIEQTRA